MNRDQLTAVDLFCGCGGCTVGLKKAGFAVLSAVDVDPLSIKTYKANHSDVMLWQTDIRELEPEELLNAIGRKRGELDLLAGCPPCQGFSTIRTLNGAVRVEDSRNDLLLEFQRFVEVLRPRAVMMENVPGLAADERFAEFCSKMNKLGYMGEHRILNAAQYDVPQRRRRLIYLAGMGMAIPFARETGRRRTVWGAIGGLPKAGESGDPLHDMPERRTPRVLKIIRRIPKNGGSRGDLPERFQLRCHKRCTGFKDVYGRMAWNDVAPTITSGCFNPSKGRFLHPEEHRAITMREAALLQGFPRWYKFPTTESKSAVALMIGNALPPPFVAAHAKSIASQLNCVSKIRNVKSIRLQAWRKEVPDNLTPEQRSYCMSRIKGWDTGLERLVRSELHKRGFRFRKNVKSLPGRPDVVLKKFKVAVFVDGDFWHGYRFPRWKDKVSRFWVTKISKNRARDIKNQRKLRKMGWRVVRLWQHDVEKDLAGSIKRVITSIKKSRLSYAHRGRL